jgi:hypothetical protein
MVWTVLSQGGYCRGLFTPAPEASGFVAAPLALNRSFLQTSPETSEGTLNFSSLSEQSSSFTFTHDQQTINHNLYRTHLA